MSYYTNIGFLDTGALDAFSRLRTSNLESVFESQLQYNLDPFRMETGNTGSGVAPSHNANTRMATLSCTNTGTSWIQSYQYSPYQPGKSQFIALTFVLGTGVANSTVDVGYFDANNGIIFRQNGNTNLQFILRTSTSGSVSDANIVAQSAWNIDKFDGTGASGLTLDVTKAQILVIDLQYLGMGRVRLGFDINGVIYYAHQFLNANNLTVPYMQTATLPVGMLVTSTGGSKSANFKCSAVQSEGGSLALFGLQSSTPFTQATAGNGTRVPILSVRPKTTFNSITNRELFILEEINLINTGNQDVFWELGIGATLTSPAWSDVNTTYSGFEYSSTPGTGTTATQIIQSGLVSRSANGSSVATIPFDPNVWLKYPIALNRAGATTTQGTLTLFVTGLSGTSACTASMNFKEIR